MPSVRTPNQSTTPTFQAFSWHNPAIFPSASVELTEHAQDIGNGVATLLELLEFSETQVAFEDPPLFKEVDKGVLLRLAISSSKLLAHFAHVQITQANRTHNGAVETGQKGGKHD
ncbi:hypothetical protein [Herbaspirillum chlorophenolicum]|uniref:hypothetical protein n=1 Tax=Herbaspirillum chlorophenolicum TaxID=211589 RepID=UPI00067C3EC9|nr:hypothetical protein [Herbaspirillum chlorophenolicum]